MNPTQNDRGGSGIDNQTLSTQLEKRRRDQEKERSLGFGEIIILDRDKTAPRAVGCSALLLDIISLNTLGKVGQRKLSTHPKLKNILGSLQTSLEMFFNIKIKTNSGLLYIKGRCIILNPALK